MAITSIDIDGDLMQSAKKILGAKSNRDAVTLALKRVIYLESQKEGVRRIADRELTEEQRNPAQIGYPPNSAT